MEYKCLNVLFCVTNLDSVLYKNFNRFLETGLNCPNFYHRFSNRDNISIHNGNFLEKNLLDCSADCCDYNRHSGHSDTHCTKKQFVILIGWRVNYVTSNWRDISIYTVTKINLGSLDLKSRNVQYSSKNHSD